MIDKNGKIFGKINIIDLIVILIIIAAVAAGGLFVVRNRRKSANQEKLIMKFYAEEVSDFVTDKLKEGSALYDDDNSIGLGKIIKFEINDSVTYGGVSEGQYTMVTKEGYKSVVITGELMGEKNELGAIVGGHQYGVGHSMVLRAGDAKIYLRVYDIAEKNEFMEYEKQQADKEKTIVVGFEADEVEDFVAQAIHVGDQIYDSSSGVVLGSVDSIEVAPAKVYVERADGSIALSSKEGYSSIKIVGRALGYLTENGGAMIDKKEYNLSKSFTMRAGKSIMEEIKVTSIEVVE